MGLSFISFFLNVIRRLVIPASCFLRLMDYEGALGSFAIFWELRLSEPILPWRWCVDSEIFLKFVNTFSLDYWILSIGQRPAFSILVKIYHGGLYKCGFLEYT